MFYTAYGDDACESGVYNMLQNRELQLHFNKLERYINSAIKY